jgi:hypothetical protein
MNTRDSQSPQKHLCYETIEKIASRIEARKQLLGVAEEISSFDNQDLDLMQSEFDITSDCSSTATKVAHECGTRSHGCSNSHKYDHNYFCSNYQCPSATSYDCSSFSCRSSASGTMGEENFDCDQSVSFRCGGQSFVCTRDHKCGGSASQQPNRTFACTNNVRCHTGRIGNKGFTCGGDNSSSAFDCGVDAAGAGGSNLFKCEYGFKCFANAQFTCEQRTIFDCKTTGTRDPFNCEPNKRGNSTYDCKQNVNCNERGSFSCAQTGKQHSCNKDNRPVFNCLASRTYNECAKNREPVYGCNVSTSNYGS